MALSALQLLTRVSCGLVHPSWLGGLELSGDHQNQLLSQLRAAPHEVCEAGAGEQVPGGVLREGVALKIGVHKASQHLQQGTMHGQCPSAGPQLEVMLGPEVLRAGQHLHVRWQRRDGSCVDSLSANVWVLPSLRAVANAIRLS